MRYCLLMHYQEGASIGLTEEDMAPAMAAFQAYADDLSAAGVLITTEVLDTVASTTTVTARNGTLEIQDGPFARGGGSCALARRRGSVGGRCDVLPACDRVDVESLGCRVSRAMFAVGA